MIKNDDLTFDMTIETSGTHLRARVDFSKEDIERISGVSSKEANAGFFEEEKGYDGWETYGMFKGRRFSLYTRWSVMRIGGDNELDVEGLIETIKSAI